MEIKKGLTISRKAYFSCGWNELKKNGKSYGSGHNLCLEAFVYGEEENDTKLLINLKDLDTKLKILIQELDHKHLNYDVSELKGEVLPEEKLIKFCFKKLKISLNEWPHIKLIRLKLSRGDKSSVSLMTNGFSF